MSASASPGPLPLALEPLADVFHGAQRRERIAAKAKLAANERSGGPGFLKEHILRGYRGIDHPVGGDF